jgi:alpha-acetolactate decarboxylase
MRGKKEKVKNYLTTKDKEKGGHLLECQASHIKIEIDHIYGFKLILLNSEDFLKMKLQR